MFGAATQVFILDFLAGGNDFSFALREQPKFEKRHVEKGLPPQRLQQNAPAAAGGAKRR